MDITELTERQNRIIREQSDIIDGVFELLPAAARILTKNFRTDTGKYFPKIIDKNYEKM